MLTINRHLCIIFCIYLLFIVCKCLLIVSTLKCSNTSVLLVSNLGKDNVYRLRVLRRYKDGHVTSIVSKSKTSIENQYTD